MRSHLDLLMRADAQLRTRLGGAQQDVTGSAVLGKIISRVCGIELARRRQLPGAGQAAPLMTDGRQLDALRFGRIPDVLVFTGFDGNFAIGSEQSD